MLLTAVCVLLLGITALLGVAYNRHQRLRDAAIDLQRNLTRQESRVAELQTKLQNCDTLQAAQPLDTSWGKPASFPKKNTSPATPPGW